MFVLLEERQLLSTESPQLRVFLFMLLPYLTLLLQLFLNLMALLQLLLLALLLLFLLLLLLHLLFELLLFALLLSELFKLALPFLLLLSLTLQELSHFALSFQFQLLDVQRGQPLLVLLFRLAGAFQALQSQQMPLDHLYPMPQFLFLFVLAFLCSLVLELLFMLKLQQLLLQLPLEYCFFFIRHGLDAHLQLLILGRPLEQELQVVHLIAGVVAITLLFGVVLQCRD